MTMVEERAPLPQRTHIPQGVADYFWQEARERRALEADLLELFRRWGYGDVVPPTFEYADVLSARANAELQAEMYRFLDRDGSTLALRPEMTIAVARLVGTRLHDWPMPQRFCYAGSVFRYTEPQAARQREFRQAGIELVGAATAAADAEVLALTARALAMAGLPAFRLVLGQMAYFDGLLADLALAPAARQLLLDAVDRNSEAGLAEFLRTVPLRTQQRRTVEELLRLSGPDAGAIIDRADRLCLNYRMHSALENLRHIYDELAARDVAHYLFIDLTEIYNLGYYTGITFEALAPELGFPVASGGRYDNLVGSFGKPQAAVGAALEIDRILLARRGVDDQGRARRPVAPHLLVNARGNAACYALVEGWRTQGYSVATDVTDKTGADLLTRAESLGARAALLWTDGGFAVYTNGQDPFDLPADAADEYVAHLLAADRASAPTAAEGSSGS